MKFGTKLKLKKDWEYNKYFTFQKDEILQVAIYEHKYGIKLHHPRIIDLLDFQFNYENRDKKIEEYFEIVEEFDDRLAELEKVILDYYLAKGYQVGIGHWNFNVEIDTSYKSKILKINFIDYEKEIDSFECKIETITTKEMFDKAFECFKSKN